MIRALFDAGVCGGKPHTRYLKALGLPYDKIAQCYDVVDNEFYQRAADDARRSPQLLRDCGLPQRYFLYVGRLAPEKNTSRLLTAYARYRASGGHWSLVLVGDGPEKETLQQQASFLGIGSSTHFAGLKNSREITVYYAFASCFVLPSKREPWGLVVNEAMASGLPVIVSRQCGCAEDLVQPGRNGFLFDPEDDAELAARLLSIDNCPDEDREAMSRKSREIIAGYSLRSWAAEVARLVQ
jgi:glycosyltransferase involved in cell wall biosynthesis